MGSKDASPKTVRESSPREGQASPKKRRKVNHACIYCRRSHMTCDLERPCQRCVKRSIGHLCHDEPRESPKNQKVVKENGEPADETLSKSNMPNANAVGPSLDQSSPATQLVPSTEGQPTSSSYGNATDLIELSTPAAQQPSASGTQNGAFGVQGSQRKVLGYSDLPQGQYQDLPNFPSYMFNAPDITEEYNVLNEFLYSSLLDDGNMYSGNSAQPLQADSSFNNTIAASTNNGSLPHAGNLKHESEKESTEKQPSSDGSNAAKNPAKPEKEDEKLYMKIADPSGNETGQERMNKLLQAKYNAGLLKPFNYVQGYARLNKYMESHLQPASRQKILKQLDKFRPKFRERMQSLTDMQLMLVEMWFERTLMEYDRVFASMAIPSCCWRRTGEIFRGNKEMAELIHVPIDQLRDGKLALHEIVAEKDLVNYWDSFLAIAFDNSQKAMLTTCSLKNPDEKAADPEIKCCFSFTIRRDAQHNIPSLIVGNFIPQIPRKS